MFKLWRFILLLAAAISFGLGFAVKVLAEPRADRSSQAQVYVITGYNGFVQIIWSDLNLQEKIHSNKPNAIMFVLDNDDKFFTKPVSQGVASFKTSPGNHVISVVPVYIELTSEPKIIYMGRVQAWGAFEVPEFLKNTWRKLWDTVT